MWLDNLKELKKAKGLTTKQIADRTQIPESTLKHIFAGDTPNPYVDTLRHIALALDSSLDEIFAETRVVVASETRAVIEAELEMLRAKTAAQEAEILFLKEKLQHKEELLALHNHYEKLKSTE